MCVQRRPGLAPDARLAISFCRNSCTRGGLVGRRTEDRFRAALERMASTRIDTGNGVVGNNCVSATPTNWPPTRTPMMPAMAAGREYHVPTD